MNPLFSSKFERKFGAKANQLSLTQRQQVADDNYVKAQDYLQQRRAKQAALDQKLAEKARLEAELREKRNELAEIRAAKASLEEQKQLIKQRLTAQQNDLKSAETRYREAQKKLLQLKTQLEKLLVERDDLEKKSKSFNKTNNNFNKASIRLILVPHKSHKLARSSNNRSKIHKPI